MAYVGNTPTTQSFISGTDYFNGDGSTVAFTLSRTVVSPNDIEAVVNNVVQQPNSAYTISGTTITFTSAPSSGSSNIYVRYLSTTTQSITPSQNTVSYSTLNSDNQSKLGISFKNRIINGAMLVDQRNAGASVTINGSGVFGVDRWQYRTNGGGIYTVQQSSTAPTGFTKSSVCTVTTADSSIASGDNYWIIQNIEGYNVADLGFGTVNAQTVTVSFWVQSSVTGTYSVALSNGTTYDRSYVTTYTISAANTWTKVSVTIPGDQTGTWGTTNGGGLTLVLNLGAGSSYQATANTWSSGFLQATSSTVQWISTLGATFYYTGVQLEVGTQATTFDYRSYGTELQLCQRYLPAWTDANRSVQFQGQATSGTTVYIPIQHPVQTRVAPTGISTTGLNAIVSSPSGSGIAVSSVSFTQASNMSTLISASVASGLTAGNASFLIFNAGQLFFTGCEL